MTWAAAHGLQVAARSGEAFTFTPAPLAVMPTAYPKVAFEKAKAVADPMARLYANVANDREWLHETLAGVIDADPFTANLLQLHKEVDSPQTMALGIFRSDYMLDGPTGDMLQIEYNTIASSFGGLAQRVGAWHAHSLARLGTEDPFLKAHVEAVTGGAHHGIPENPTTEQLAAGLAAAHKAHGGGTALFVVQPGERNTMDQRHIEYALYSNHQVPAMRRTLAQIAESGRIDATGALVLDGQAVSVAYFRAGYTPDDYPTEQEWAARRMIESSDAIKCPTLAYQLSGAKKVQQALAAPKALDRFLEDQADKDAISASFAGLWALGPEADEESVTAVAEAMEHPERFVMKPQREGGGFNTYGAAIAEKLKVGAHDKSLADSILMQRIMPPPQPQWLLRAEEDPLRCDAVCELGIYTVFLGNATEAPLNDYAGWLLRVKPETVDEGGVAAGYACLGAPLLV